MIINKTTIEPGKIKKLDVHIAKLPSHSPINMSVTVARAVEPGPVLLLAGGLHGDEINGIEIVRRIIEQHLNIPTRGTVICIPIINVYGFIHFSRYVPDGKDVNRSFPGNKNGSLAARVANYLMTDIIPKIDYGIDFHTGGAERTNFPQIRCMTGDPINLELAHAFHAPYTLHAKHRPNSLRQSAYKLGKRILVYEGGESSRFDEYAIQEGVNGAVRLMKHLDMTHAVPLKPAHPTRLVTSSTWIRARVSGMFQAHINYGQPVTRNQILGYITDPFGGYKIPLKAKAKGHVIGLNNNPLVHAGDALIHIGLVKS